MKWAGGVRKEGTNTLFQKEMITFLSCISLDLSLLGDSHLGLISHPGT